MRSQGILLLLAIAFSSSVLAEPSAELKTARQLLNELRTQVHQAGSDADPKLVRRLQIVRDNVIAREISEGVPPEERTKGSVANDPKAMRAAQAYQANAATTEMPPAAPTFTKGDFYQLAGRGPGHERVVQVLGPDEHGLILVQNQKKELSRVHHSFLRPSVDQVDGFRVGEQVKTGSQIGLKVQALFPDGTAVTQAREGSTSFGADRVFARGQFQRHISFGERFHQFARGGTLGLAPLATGLLRLNVDQQTEEDFDSGRCPQWHLDSPDVFMIAIRMTTEALRMSARDCQDNGRKLDFSHQLPSVLNHKSAGFSQVTCRANGEIAIVLKNGTQATVSFSQASRLTQIRAFFPDEPQAPQMQVSIDEGDQVRSSQNLGARTENRKESWASLTNRYYCSLNLCSQDEVMRGFEDSDDLTTARRPYGAFDRSRMTRLSETLIVLKKAIVSIKAPHASYAETCRGWGGSEPSDISFRESEADSASQTISGAKKAIR